MKVPFNSIFFFCLRKFIHVPNIILGAVDNDGDYDGDEGDDNYDGGTDQDHELL